MTALCEDSPCPALAATTSASTSSAHTWWTGWDSCPLGGRQDRTVDVSGLFHLTSAAGVLKSDKSVVKYRTEAEPEVHQLRQLRYNSNRQQDVCVTETDCI